MTLREAYEDWRVQSKENEALARNCRLPIATILLNKYGDRDVREFTAFFTGRLFRESPSAQGSKVKAASVLVYVLKHAAGKGECQRPDFDHTVANDGSISSEKEKRSTTVIQTSPAKESPCPEVLAEEASGAKALGLRCRGRKGKPVVQLDKETLKPMFIFPSMAAAGQAMSGSVYAKCAIRMAVKLRKTAYGFFWCLQGREGKFKPSSFTTRKTNSSLVKSPNNYHIVRESVGPPVLESPTTDKSVPEVERLSPSARSSACERQASVSLFSTEELCNELVARGWKITVERL